MFRSVSVTRNPALRHRAAEGYGVRHEWNSARAGRLMTPCDNCHAGCCRSFAVPVTGADILRIQRRLKLDFWDFVCRWEDRDGKISNHYAPQFHFNDSPEVPYAICLLHGDSQFFPGTGRCRFLVEGAPSEKEPLGQARCGIHPWRPSACRVFPTRMTPDSNLAMVHEVPDIGRDSGEPQYRLCSRPWAPSDVDPIAAIQDLVVAQFEANFFHEVAAKWNARPGEWEFFPVFLDAVYSNRVVPEAVATPTILPFPRAPHAGSNTRSMGDCAAA